MTRNWLCILFLGVFGLLVACGGKKGDTNSPSDVPKTFDTDPLALLPSGAIGVARLDTKAMYAAGGSGAELGKLTERFIPIGEETGFSAPRDLETVYAGSYSLQGLDVIAVMVGKFDADKIQKAAEAKTKLKGGGVLVASPYAGRTIYTVSNFGFTVLTGRTVIAGTETAVRRALDRCRDGVPTRTLSEVMVKTLETEGAHIALAADLSAHPLPNISIGPLQLPGTQGLKVVRVLGDFKAPGLNIAGTLTYDTEANAQTGVEGLRKAAKFVSGLSAVAPVPRLDNFEAKADKVDVQAKFSVDDKALKDLLVALPGLLN
jgi:hypothetical protein